MKEFSHEKYGSHREKTNLIWVTFALSKHNLTQLLQQNRATQKLLHFLLQNKRIITAFQCQKISWHKISLKRKRRLNNQRYTTKASCAILYKR